MCVVPHCLRSKSLRTFLHTGTYALTGQDASDKHMFTHISAFSGALGSLCHWCLDQHESCHRECECRDALGILVSGAWDTVSMVACCTYQCALRHSALIVKCSGAIGLSALGDMWPKALIARAFGALMPWWR